MLTVTTATSLGSGVVVDAAGVFVTNLHVIRGETTVSVKLANGDVYDDVSVVDVGADFAEVAGVVHFRGLFSLSPLVAQASSLQPLGL